MSVQVISEQGFDRRGGYTSEWIIPAKENNARCNATYGSIHKHIRMCIMLM